MRHILENETIRIELDSHGAELKSARKGDREYMWCGDPKFWNRTSPVLFPFVGSLKNKEFILEGKAWPMAQHGFARDMEFELLSKKTDELWFCLKDNDDTLAKYPFPFTLRIGYKIQENTLKVIWEVDNPGSGSLPFSIGAHPAFCCPLCGEADKTGYSLSFGKLNNTCTTNDEDPVNNAETKYKNIKLDAFSTTEPVSEIHHHGNDTETGLSITEDIKIPLQGGLCDITPGFFDRCTYIIEDAQINSIGIVDPKGHEYVDVLFDTPLVAVWSPEGKNAPFICIEPWYGRCDHVGFNGDIWEREHTNILAAGESFHSEYVIRFK